MAQFISTSRVECCACGRYRHMVPHGPPATPMTLSSPMMYWISCSSASSSAPLYELITLAPESLLDVWLLGLLVLLNMLLCAGTHKFSAGSPEEPTERVAGEGERVDWAPERLAGAGESEGWELMRVRSRTGVRVREEGPDGGVPGVRGGRPTGGLADPDSGVAAGELSPEPVTARVPPLLPRGVRGPPRPPASGGSCLP
mmetsp:Transcript_7203/g.15715  ORF Transcript_7203/g.15715 Transcript_7203/m.15715 type:complete len:200 (+) Transcript_7203:853-1452(+)